MNPCGKVWGTAVGAWLLGFLFVFGASPPTDSSRGQVTPGEPALVIGVGGDVLPESSWLGPQGAEHFLDGMRSEFARVDLVFLNLEEPVTRSTQATSFKSAADVAAGRDYILRARNPAIPRYLQDAGVGLVGLANNHMMDYGVAGLRDTLRGFREIGLPVVGAGFKLDAERAYIFEMSGRRVALLAFSDVVPRSYGATESHLGIASSKTDSDLVNAIRRARRDSDHVVLMIHWGGQGNHLITPRQRHLGRVAAEAGCDVVVGMHPHVLQAAEFFGSVPVLYSIGNFAFAARRPAARESVFVRLVFGAQKLEATELVPVEISARGEPQVAAGVRGEEILRHFDGFCRMFNTRISNGKLIRSQPREALVYDEEKVRRARGARTGATRRGRPTGTRR